MDELFRMIALRAPDTTVGTGSLSVSSGSAWQQTLPAQGTAAVKRRALQAAATVLQASANYVGDVSKLKYGPAINAFYSTSDNPAQAPQNLAALAALISKSFGMAASALVKDPEFIAETANIQDSLVAAFITPSPATNLLADLTRAIELFNLVQRTAANDPTLTDAASIQAALTLPILLPSPAFPIAPNTVAAVGIGDLLVVRQHPLRYEAAQISYVENILSGETKGRDEKHDLQTVQTNMTETDNTTTTFKDLQTTDQSALSTATQSQVQQTLNAQAGVTVSAAYGSLKINANASVAYANSQSQSNQVATQTAHDIVNQAATTVTNQTISQQTSQITETYKQGETHSFSNPSPNPDVVGVYQWINEIDRAQVFNYGKRVLFDLVVPEPAAFLLDAATTAAAASAANAVAMPAPFTVQPGQLSPDQGNAFYYGKYVAQYGAVGVPGYPADHITVTKAFYTSDPKSQGSGATDLVIPDGYAAQSVTVQAIYNYTGDKNDSGISVFVGTAAYLMNGQVESPDTPNPRPLANKEEGSISIAIHTYNASDYAVDVDILCAITSDAIAAWQAKVYDAIYNAYTAQLSAYSDSLKVQQFNAPTVGPLGSANPGDNLITEQIELKKSCIAMLSDIDLLTFDGVQQDPVNPAPPAAPARAFPRVNWPPAAVAPADVADQGSLIRFFEQAFEWENLMYIFYPYFWGRKATWYDNVLQTNADPLFQQFLNAGAARVVIPVRPGFESAVSYYMITLQPWNGGGLPSINDPTYLPIAQEIADSEGAPENEIPVGDPWEVTIPTQQVILTGGSLPGWQQPDPTQWVWTPSPAAAANAPAPAANAPAVATKALAPAARKKAKNKN
jgi:hypothetical protein